MNVEDMKHHEGRLRSMSEEIKKTLRECITLSMGYNIDVLKLESEKPGDEVSVDDIEYNLSEITKKYYALKAVEEMEL